MSIEGIHDSVENRSTFYRKLFKECLPLVLNPDLLVTMTVVLFSAPVSKDRSEVLIPLSAAKADARASLAPSDSISASADSKNTSRAAVETPYCDKHMKIHKF